MTSPAISIVIPVYNEAKILASSIEELVGKLGPLGRSFEIILAENGSTDDTVAIGERLAAQANPSGSLRIMSIGAPNYGKALRRAILEARGELVFCDEIDLCDVDFYTRALPLLEAKQADLVVGSKAMKGSSDDRPMLRRVATRIINLLLRLLVGFRGTDTHGLKAFRRAVVAPVAGRCKVEKDLFASELVIRAYREGLAVLEIPVQVHEKRRPSVNLFRRVPNVLRNLVRLTVLFRQEEGATSRAAGPPDDQGDQNHGT